MAYTKGSIQPGSAKARILELLVDKATGLHSRQIAIALDISEQRANTACYEMGKHGLVVGVNDGIGAGKATRQKRWCLQVHEATTRAAVQKAPAKASVWAKAGLGSVTRRGTPAADKVKVTVAPPTPDARFTVDKPEPFFSRPGYRPEFIGADTWAAKVYGS